MLDLFIEFEYNQKLFTKEIQNIKYWHLIRTEIYNDILKQIDDIPQAHQSKIYQSKTKLLTAKIKQTKNIFIKNPFALLEERDYLIFNHPRRVKEGDHYKSLYTSDLIEKLEKNYYLYEIPYHEKHFSPVLEDEKKHTDIIINKYLVKRIIVKFFKKEIITDEETKNINKLIETINTVFNVNLSVEYWIQKIENRILYYNTAYQSYLKIIEKIKPKVIIQVVSYLNSRFVINKIAKEKGIPTIELQHGVMGGNHVSYNFYKKMEIDTFPDYIFTFGEYWKENTRLPIDKSKVIPVGWPHYELKQNSFIKKSQNKKVLLFISQGTIGRELSKIACDLNSLLD